MVLLCFVQSHVFSPTRTDTFSQLTEPVGVEWKKQCAEVSPVCLALGNVCSFRHLFAIFLSQFPNGSCSISLRGNIFLALYCCERCLKEIMLSFMLTMYEVLLSNGFDQGDECCFDLLSFLAAWFDAQLSF